ncbi:putative inactive histone-lysine N-methyltransferase SUVR2 [Silene latifolia]|uniref:putative inactive histone-lysine N-methyltransferase SUVR2 n=1 Tax=Silene latifolia TaxID=37657 RepID=UPI003D776D43
MAPNPRVKKAFAAMKAIGISQEKTKPALKKLLNVFDKNWDAIEAEEYRVLADAIFEYEEAEMAEKEKKKKPENADREEASEMAVWQDGSIPDETMQDEPERPLKRLRLKHQGHGAGSNGQLSPTAGGSALMIPKAEPGEPDTSPSQCAQLTIRSPRRNTRANSQLVSPQSLPRRKGKEPATSHNDEPSSVIVQPSEKPSQALRLKESRTEQGTATYGNQKQAQMIGLITPKDEPITDDVVSIEPLAVVLPESLNNKAPSKSANQVGKQDSQRSRTMDGVDEGMGSLASTAQEKQLQKVDVSDRASSKLNIAASTLGKVQISLTCNPVSEEHEMHMPDLEAVLKKVNDNCLKTYKIMDPEFSVTKLMKQFCDCVEELGQIVDDSMDNRLSTIPLCSSLNEEACGDVAVTNNRTLANNMTPPLVSTSPEIDMQSEINAIAEMNLKSIVVASPYDTSDITMGREMVKVSLEKFNCEFLPTFHYISRNIILDNADVKFSLAQFGDQDCCFSCHADCLSPSLSCNCARHNGGELSYTADGLVKEQFLNECVSLVRNPQKHDLTFCEVCQLELFKNEDILDPCKGHLKRKFLKECYTKCGCSQNCGNRVVQGGLRCNLQVFWTPEGKGWGLRALDNLPKGAFVCEFVGEILTMMELRERNLSRSNDKHSYSLLLDTDWGTRALKEEEFLCLDATLYGNVARFINHRCTDANLIEIPVEVETPSHHYYHIALFTTRDVNAFEELTWDYGVDFDDNEQYMKTFSCLCGSQFCRNMKRSRPRSALTLQ